MTAAGLFVVELPDVTRVEGPLLFVEGARGASWGEMVRVVLPGETRHGQVVEVYRDKAVVQVFTGTRGLGLDDTRVRRTGRPIRIGVGRDLLGRVFDGNGEPIDGLPPPLPEAVVDVHGQPLNPLARDHPNEFIQTGVSAIDGLNTLVRGQKLPIFSGFGLPADQLAVDIASRATVRDGADFAVIFAAMGITRREESFFRHALAEGGALSRTAVFLNRADDPTLERLLVPRKALTLAEFLAFERDMHVLVILTDMTHYCEALREVATAREEVPGRRGFPGYMYTDLAGIYERAGRVRGRRGSVTQLVLLSMPDDDITHPIPDLTGYITEGQIVLSRSLHRRGVDPPIDVLPSLSRLMNAGIGEGRTREDHRAVADQLYALYARGQDLRRMVAIVGEAALSEEDKRYLGFAEAFEQEFVNQAGQARTLEDTLSVAWRLLAPFPDRDLKRIPQQLIDRYGRR